MPSGEFNDENDPQSVFCSGLLRSDPEAVAWGIKQGANVNHNNDDINHPVLGIYKRLGVARVLGDSYADEAACRISILRQLLEVDDLDLLSKDDDELRIADLVYIYATEPEKTEFAADIIIKTLLQADLKDGSSYTPNMNYLFLGYGGEARDLAMDGIKLVHKHVQERLQNPKTKEEKYLVGNCREKIDFWVQDFEAPDIDTLPAPSAEFIKAVESMGEACNGLMQERSSLLPQETRYLLDKANNASSDAEKASRAMKSYVKNEFDI